MLLYIFVILTNVSVIPITYTAIHFCYTDKPFRYILLYIFVILTNVSDILTYTVRYTAIRRVQCCAACVSGTNVTARAETAGSQTNGAMTRGRQRNLGQRMI
jgi:uncharacterized protein YlbG (UPF0298 family)